MHLSDMQQLQRCHQMPVQLLKKVYFLEFKENTYSQMTSHMTESVNLVVLISLLPLEACLD